MTAKTKRYFSTRSALGAAAIIVEGGAQMVTRVYVTEASSNSLIWVPYDSPADADPRAIRPPPAGLSWLAAPAKILQRLTVGSAVVYRN